MKKKYFVSVILLLMCFLNSCEKPVLACGCDDPLGDLLWLKSKLEHYYEADVYLYNYNDQEYIGISVEAYLPYGRVVIWDCEGNYICNYPDIHLPCEIGSAPRKLLFSIKNNL